MDMHAVPVDADADALRELAGTLPRGRVFHSSRAAGRAGIARK